jgi:squalene monooxygenase
MFILFFYLGEELQVLQTGCFKYFECGGECVNGPVTLLSGFVSFDYHSRSDSVKS